MNDEWYYSVNSDRQGPVSWDQLRDLAAAGTLKPADLVWKDGMAEWAEAKTVAGLIPPGGAAPRPARRNDAADDDRPRPRRRDRDDDDADDRPRRRPADDDADDDDRPSRSRRAVDDDDDDRPSRSRRAVADEDRPSRSRRAVNPEAGSKKVAAGLFALLLGGFGVHKFYLGMSGPGSIMLAMTLGGWAGCISGFFCLVTLPIGLAAFASGVIALIEGIIYLTKTDAEFDRIYIRGQKQWF